MKTVKCVITVMLLLVLTSAVWSQTSQKHEVLFEKAKYTMETKGDLQGAIKLFNQLIKNYPKEKECRYCST